MLGRLCRKKSWATSWSGPWPGLRIPKVEAGRSRMPKLMRSGHRNARTRAGGMHHPGNPARAQHSAWRAEPYEQAPIPRRGPAPAQIANQSLAHFIRQRQPLPHPCRGCRSHRNASPRHRGAKRPVRRPAALIATTSTASRSRGAPSRCGDRKWPADERLRWPSKGLFVMRVDLW